jgi:hypothetical protein
MRGSIRVLSRFDERRNEMMSEEKFDEIGKVTTMEFDSFKKEIFTQNQMISSRLFIMSDMLNDLQAEIEAIDAALIKE